MAGSSFGSIFRITTWGESHGAGLGVVVDGCPAGLPLCEEDIQIFLNRGRANLPHLERKTIPWRFCPVFLKAKPPEHQFPCW